MHVFGARREASAIRDSARSWVVTRPMAPRSSNPRTIASAPCSRSCELVPLKSSSSRNSTGELARREPDNRAHPRDLGIEPRLPGLQRVLHAQRGADRQGREAQAARREPARPPGPARRSMPTVRSSVLLPDMLEPLTTSIRVAPPRAPCSEPPAPGSSGWAMPFALEAGAALHTRGTDRPDARRRSRRSEQSASSSPRPLQPFAQARPRLPPPALDGESHLRPHNRKAAAGANSWFWREFSKSISSRSCAMRREGIRPAVLNRSTMCRSRSARNASRSNRANTAVRSARSRAGASTLAQDCADWPQHGEREEDLGDDDQREGQRSTLAERPGRERHGGAAGQDRGHHRRPAGLDERRCAAPARQQIRMATCAHLVPEQREVFAQVDERLQLADGVLPSAHFRDVRRREQPSRECLFPRANAGRRQQLEERAAPEQIEVGRIGVIGNEEPLARFAGPGPRVGHTRDALLVEFGRPARACARTQHAVVPYDGATNTLPARRASQTRGRAGGTPATARRRRSRA